MKKRIGVLSFIIVFAALLSSCGSDNENKVYVYNWGDYIDETVLDDFEEETGIKVEYDTFDSNEAMYVKIKASPGTYDVALPSDYMIAKMIEEGMVEEINWDNIPNVKNLNSRFMNTSYDPNGKYTAPYMWGTVGILYNKNLVSDTVDSWDILWDEDYKGKIFMYDSVRDSLGISLKRLGYSLNSKNIDQLTEAKDALIAQKPLVQTYLTDPVKDKMIGEEGALAVVYSGDAMYAKTENDALEYVIPKEGSNIWYDGLIIPKDAPNKENAEKFIDYMCRPDVAAKNSEYIGYSTANTAAFDLLPEESRNNYIFNPDESDLERCEMFEDLGDFIEKYNDAWNEIFTAN